MNEKLKAKQSAESHDIKMWFKADKLLNHSSRKEIVAYIDSLIDGDDKKSLRWKLNKLNKLNKQKGK